MKFESIMLNDHEVKFSQPKREFFGLECVLEVNEDLLIGCRKLIVETDVEYLHGRLNHLEMGPDTTINCWIKKVLMFHFTIKHVVGKTFGPYGLSWRERQGCQSATRDSVDRRSTTTSRVPRFQKRD